MARVAGLATALVLVALPFGPKGLMAAAADPSGAAASDAGQSAAAPRLLMTWGDLFSRPKPKADLRIAYGPLPQQFGELWLPRSPVGAPLVLMVHGGCWTKSIADLQIMNYAADDLRSRGMAVWNIEYRGVDEPGGGYPGTYLDVAAGLDAAVDLARRHHLRLDPAVAVGHSAGGHLALWAAGRPRIPPSSPLHSARPLRIGVVVDLAGLADLETNTATACGPSPVAAMVGAPSVARQDVYADTSPAAMVPLGVAQYVIHGASDHTVVPEIGAAYAERARAAGDEVHLSTPDGGHVEAIAPGAAAWSATAALLAKLTRP